MAECKLVAVCWLGDRRERERRAARAQLGAYPGLDPLESVRRQKGGDGDQGEVDERRQRVPEVEGLQQWIVDQVQASMATTPIAKTA